jgi:AcrR family transcriptional regulator
MARPHDPNAKIALLQAAEAVFVEHGLEHARVEDITARAGRSKGSFYLHFQGKEDAFRQIVETMMARLATCLDEPPPASPAVQPGRAHRQAQAGAEAHPRCGEGEGETDVPALLARWLDKDVEVFEFLWQNRGICRLLMGGGGSSDFAYLIDGFAERCNANIRAWLLWGMERGIYRSHRPRGRPRARPEARPPGLAARRPAAPRPGRLHAFLLLND